jgi:hypothetical protein
MKEYKYKKEMSDFLDYCKKNNIRLEGQKQYEEIIK